MLSFRVALCKAPIKITVASCQESEGLSLTEASKNMKKCQWAINEHLQSINRYKQTVPVLGFSLTSLISIDQPSLLLQFISDRHA